MKVNSLFKTALLAGALGFSGSSQGAIIFDINGGAPGGEVVLDLFDWFPGNGLFHEAVPIPALAVGTRDFDFLIQGELNLSALDAGTEVTFQARIPMRGSVVPIAGIFELGINSILAGGVFDIYFDGAANSSDITGLGFDDGTHILHGDILPSLAGDPLGTINIQTSSAGLLDQFGADDQGAVTTVGVSGNIPTVRVEIEADVGSSNASVAAIGFDLDFFPADMNGDTIDVPDDGDPLTMDHDLQLSSDNLAPFENANPSDLVYGEAPDYGADGINNNTCGMVPVGTVCDLHVESDGRSPFRADLAVPEPATLGLLGIAMLGFAAGARGIRRRIA